MATRRGEVGAVIGLAAVAGLVVPACSGGGPAARGGEPTESAGSPAASAECVGPADVRQAPADWSGGSAMFPVLLPVANADPALRHAETLLVPTRLALRRAGEQVEAAWDAGSLEAVEVGVGCHMILGHEVRTGVVQAGAELVESATELGGGADFSGAEGGAVLLVAPPPGDPAARWVVRAELTVFETDIAPQHEWSPRSGRFRVLFERTIEAAIDFPAEM